MATLHIGELELPLWDHQTKGLLHMADALESIDDYDGVSGARGLYRLGIDDLAVGLSIDHLDPNYQLLTHRMRELQTAHDTLRQRAADPTDYPTF